MNAQSRVLEDVLVASIHGDRPALRRAEIKTRSRTSRCWTTRMTPSRSCASPAGRAAGRRHVSRPPANVGRRQGESLFAAPVTRSGDKRCAGAFRLAAQTVLCRSVGVAGCPCAPARPGASGAASSALGERTISARPSRTSRLVGVAGGTSADAGAEPVGFLRRSHHLRSGCAAQRVARDV
jgi:hypothetical protein